MPIPEIRITVSNSLLNLSDKFQGENRAIYNEVLEATAADLRARSPVGATSELKSGWTVIAARRAIGSLRASIVNRAPGARFRIVGRGPGKMPPREPIEKWVVAKGGGSAAERRSRVYLIRRKIAREGTDRWKDNDNFLGINRDQPVNEAEIFQRAKQEIINRVNNIKLS